MKKVKEFKESEPEKQEYYFDMTLTDGHTSQIKVIKEMGEYVLVGDDRQHFSESELHWIVAKMNKLNSRIYQPLMMEDNDCDCDCDNCDINSDEEEENEEEDFD